MTHAQQAFQTVRDGDIEGLRAVLEQAPEVAGAANGQGISLLLYALYRRRKEMVTVLRALRPQISLFEAAALGETEVLQAHLLDSPAAVGAISADGFRPLHLASFFGRKAAVRLLLERGADPNAITENVTGATALHTAAAAGHVGVAALLIRCGANVNALRSDRLTPLHAAAATGNAKLVTALLEAGAGWADTTHDGKTAADLAFERGHPHVAATLMGRTA